MSVTFELRGREHRLPAPIVGIPTDGERAIAGVIPTATVREGDDLVTYEMSPDALDFGLVVGGRAPVLESHRRSLDFLLGMISAAWLDGETLCFTARLAPVVEADRVWAFLSASFPLSISAGSEILEADATGETEWGGRRIVVSRWRLTEVSICLFGKNPDAHAVRLNSSAGREILASRQPGNADAARDRLRLDRWTRWAVPAGFRLAEQLGADPGRTTAALQAEVERHCSQLVEEQIA